MKARYNHEDISFSFLLTNKKECCGCSGCSAVCPKQAISLIPDSEGFIYPQIDNNKCIGCNICISFCPFKRRIDHFETDSPHILLEEPMVFAARLKDEVALRESASGGVFTALSEPLLTDGNAIVCSSFDYEKGIQRCVLIDTAEDRDKARGSIYTQSNSNGIFERAYTWLKNNPSKKILLVGTGCFADSFLSYAKRKGIESRVLVVDIICHGAPSPQIFQDLFISIEEKYGRISKVSFKDKRHGWSNPTAYCIANEKEISLTPYRKVYSNRYITRPSCGNCPYTRVNRDVDITIGDYWHIEKTIPEFADDKGVSVVIIHSHEGLSLFQQALKMLDVRRSNANDCWQKNLEQPTPSAPDRSDFWKDYRKMDIFSLLDKYSKLSIGRRAKRKLLQKF